MSYDEVQNNKLQMLGKLSASLLHEIRNPLSAIKLNLDYLNMLRNELPEEAVESVSGCSEAVHRIQMLIDMLLDFSKKANSKDDVSCLNDIIISAVNIVMGNSTKKNVKINSHLSDGLPQVKISKYKLLQVLLNLLTNAIEACEKGGEVCVKTYFDLEKNVVCEVADNGVGIKEEDKVKIFQDFFTKKNNGTGLGLSVCRMLLAEHNSELYFESEYGSGTTFYIKFNKITSDK